MRVNTTSRPSGESRGSQSYESGSPMSRWSEPSASMRQSVWCMPSSITQGSHDGPTHGSGLCE